MVQAKTVREFKAYCTQHNLHGIPHSHHSWTTLQRELRQEREREGTAIQSSAVELTQRDRHSIPHSQQFDMLQREFRQEREGKDSYPIQCRRVNSTIFTAFPFHCRVTSRYKGNLDRRGREGDSYPIQFNRV